MNDIECTPPPPPLLVRYQTSCLTPIPRRNLTPRFPPEHLVFFKALRISSNFKFDFPLQPREQAWRVRVQHHDKFSRTDFNDSRPVSAAVGFAGLAVCRLHFCPTCLRLSGLSLDRTLWHFPRRKARLLRAYSVTTTVAALLCWCCAPSCWPLTDRLPVNIFFSIHCKAVTKCVAPTLRIATKSVSKKRSL